MKAVIAQTATSQLTPAELWAEIERRKIGVTHWPGHTDGQWRATCVAACGQYLFVRADSAIEAVEKLLALIGGNGGTNGKDADG